MHDWPNLMLAYDTIGTFKINCVCVGSIANCIKVVLDDVTH